MTGTPALATMKMTRAVIAPTLSRRKYPPIFCGACALEVGVRHLQRAAQDAHENDEREREDVGLAHHQTVDDRADPAIHALQFIQRVLDARAGIFIEVGLDRHIQGVEGVLAAAVPVFEILDVACERVVRRAHACSPRDRRLMRGVRFEQAGRSPDRDSGCSCRKLLVGGVHAAHLFGDALSRHRFRELGIDRPDAKVQLLQQAQHILAGVGVLRVCSSDVAAELRPRRSAA